MIDITINDDYAVLTTTNYGFYYGYEYDTKECECGETEEIWGFEVNGNNGKLFGISADDMKKIKDCPDKWDCEAMLLFGIGLFINEVTIDLIKKVESDEQMEANYVHKDSTTLVQDELVKNELKQIELQHNALKQQKFNELLKEIQELKKQVETYEIEGYTQNEELNKMSFDIRKYKIQQKEFIKYLEAEKDRLARECSNIYEDSLGHTRLVNEDIFDEVNDILQKYKEIIGVSDENNTK